MIGIFDSGSGGLTVLSAIREVLPSSDVLYFGDIKNAPYGNRRRRKISALTTEAIQLLLERDATKIISACNSVSASLAVSFLDAFDLGQAQLIEMVGPTVRYFKGSDAKVLVCATPATVHSRIYQNAFRMVGQDVTMCAIPDLAGLIEFGPPAHAGESKKAIYDSIKKALKNFDVESFNVLVLSCTHYPLVKDIFTDVLKGKGVVLFDPAYEVAERAERLWWPQESGEGITKFLISADSETFRSRVKELFPNTPYTIEIINEHVS